MKILFSSYHNYFDFTSPAAFSTRTLLLELVKLGAEVRTCCGCFFDSADYSWDEFLRYCRGACQDLKLYQAKIAFPEGPQEFRYLNFNDSGILSTALFPADAFQCSGLENRLSPSSGQLFLTRHLETLRSFSPDVCLTYGGYWAAKFAAEQARKQGAKNVFLLYNLAYKNRQLFELFDSTLVPSQFSQDDYRKRLNIKTTVIPALVDRQFVIAKQKTRKFLTIVNPSNVKELSFFSGIVKVLTEKRPDIPILVVSGQNQANNFLIERVSNDAKNISGMKVPPMPSKYFEYARIILVPKFTDEAFGRGAAAAALNGIPVICSDRGALPEAVADQRFALKTSDDFKTTESGIATEEEVREWVELIIKLWDDECFYNAASKDFQDMANARFDPKTVAEQTLRHLNSVVKQKRR